MSTTHHTQKRYFLTTVITILLLVYLNNNNNDGFGVVDAIRCGNTAATSNGRSILSLSHSKRCGFCSSTLTLTTSSSSSSSSSQFLRTTTKLFDSSSSSSSSREEEIRKKIQQLQEEGKLGKSQPSPEAFQKINANAYDDYADKLQGKLGKRKSKLMGFTGTTSKSCSDDIDDIDDDYSTIESIDDEEEDTEDGGRRRMGRIGSLPDFPSQKQPQLEDTTMSSYSSALEEQLNQKQKININPAIFDLKRSKDDEESVEPPELSEEELIELVAEKLAEKRAIEDAAIEAASIARREAAQASETTTSTTTTVEKGEEQSTTTTKKTTTGIGGTWTKNETSTEEYYQPKTGSWGKFPRPKDVSKAYGGGRRIGVGFSNEDDETAKMNTKRLLKDYRKKAGIEVPTEKEHAVEIEEALSIGQRAMQRGVYATAVSALEKVTQWCSTNSKVGSKVYLELAMAYEAVGRTSEAVQVYKTLSDCRMEDVKYNARRLLYGMEAMEVMKSVSSDFSRKKSTNAFVDATGLANIAQNFDDVYQTAYIDLDADFYKKLTESVVRSTREARQILIKATGKGEVTRTRIVQALRCISRQYTEILQIEISATVKEEPTAFLNGKPIVKGKSSSNDEISIGDFNLLSAEEMIQNLDGEWRLQLLADKKGDGVSYFNTSTAIQTFSTDDMTFSASGPSGLVNFKCSGSIDMEDTKRMLSKTVVETSNTGFGGILSILSGGRDSGFSAAVSRQQQIISADSLLLITRCTPGSRKPNDADKEHFGVWRRVVAPEDN
ncbi:MAG: hypothetical protein ACI90V_005629 [Bacillariaceae sp.]|jgi:hypothetical protein